MTTPATPRGLAAPATHRTADARLAAAEAAAAEHLAGWQRARADYENLRKELDDRLKNESEAAQDALLQELLPVLDYFDAAIRHVPEELRMHAWMEGILRIAQAFRTFLTEADVQTVGEVGIPLDPVLYEAVAKETSPLPPGTITTVAAPGYVRKGRVLRPAKVRVSEGPAKKNPET